MDWDALGAIGEVVGAVGVIVTLGYLAIQIRNSNAWQKGQGFRDAVQLLSDACKPIGQDPNLYNRGRASYGEMDEDERLQFHVMITTKYGAFESFYDFQKSDDIKLEAIGAVNRWIMSDFTHPGVREWWDDIGRATFSEDFSGAVDLAVTKSISGSIQKAGI